MIVNTTSGRIQGFEQDNMKVFRGVPFAKAGRFQNAQPIFWDGVMDCRNWRDMPPQKPGGLQNSFEGAPGISEDCLNLNIATTSLDPEAKLPILVQIYGGAFNNGNNAMPERCEPAIWLKTEDMVFVSINYRVNVFGFLYLSHLFGEGYEGNYGLSDQIAALRWVHENARAFGGDPDRITIYGYSAGGKSVGALLAARETKDMIHQAIFSSGGFQAIRTPETASVVADRYLECLGHKDLDYLMQAPMEELMEAFYRLTAKYAPTCLFGPVSDDKLIGKDWFDYIQSEDGWKGAVLIGASRRELGMTRLEEAPGMLEGLFGDNQVYARASYQKLVGDSEDPALQHRAWIQVLSDYMYRTHTDRAAKLLTDHGCPVWLFSMEMAPALHVMTDQVMWTHGRDEEDPVAGAYLADVIHEMYRSFVCQGRPFCKDMAEWKTLKEGNHKLLLDKKLSLLNMSQPDTLMDFPEDAIRLQRLEE